MAEAQLISQLKFRVGSLESALADRQRELEDIRGIEGQADSKIKGTPFITYRTDQNTQRKSKVSAELYPDA